MGEFSCCFQLRFDPEVGRLHRVARSGTSRLLSKHWEPTWNFRLHQSDSALPTL
jgi:hypothetical protein